MRFATTQKGETLSAFVDRVYKCTSDDERKKLTKLVREANPELSARGNLPDESIVIIPRVKGVETATEVRTEREALASNLRNVAERTADLRDELTQQVEREENQVRETLKVAKSRDVKRLAKTDELIQDRLNTVTNNLNARLKRNKTIKELNSKTMEELQTDIDALLAMAEGREEDAPKQTPSKRKKKR